MSGSRLVYITPCGDPSLDGAIRLWSESSQVELFQNCVDVKYTVVDSLATNIFLLDNGVQYVVANTSRQLLSFLTDANGVTRYGYDFGASQALARPLEIKRRIGVINGVPSRPIIWRSVDDTFLIIPATITTVAGPTARSYRVTYEVYNVTGKGTIPLGRLSDIQQAASGINGVPDLIVAVYPTGQLVTYDGSRFQVRSGFRDQMRVVDGAVLPYEHNLMGARLGTFGNYFYLAPRGSARIIFLSSSGKVLPERRPNDPIFNRGMRLDRTPDFIQPVHYVKPEQDLLLLLNYDAAQQQLRVRLYRERDGKLVDTSVRIVSNIPDYIEPLRSTVWYGERAERKLVVMSEPGKLMFINLESRIPEKTVTFANKWEDYIVTVPSAAELSALDGSVSAPAVPLSEPVRPVAVEDVKTEVLTDLVKISPVAAAATTAALVGTSVDVPAGLVIEAKDELERLRRENALLTRQLAGRDQTLVSVEEQSRMYEEELRSLREREQEVERKLAECQSRPSTELCEMQVEAERVSKNAAIEDCKRRQLELQQQLNDLLATTSAPRLSPTRVSLSAPRLSASAPRLSAIPSI